MTLEVYKQSPQISLLHLEPPRLMIMSGLVVGVVRRHRHNLGLTVITKWDRG